MNVPLYLQPLDKDGTGTYEKVDFWWNVLINLAFNAGYQLRDLLWIILELETPAAASNQIDYWYRYGFVVGDMYMRLFFRTLVDAPEKIKTMPGADEEEYY